MKYLMKYFLLVAIIFSHQSFSIPAKERQALIDIYNATNGSTWINNDNWLDDEGTECNWYGVGCYNGTVFRIELPSNNLNGQLPSSIGDFGYIRYMHLQDNNINGSIPSSIGNLKSLYDQAPCEIDLSNNELIGSIPQSYGTLPIDSICLSNNNLTGKIPDNIGPRLYIYLQGNNLSGEVPENLSAQILNLRGNNLEGKLAIDFNSAICDDTNEIIEYGLSSGNACILDLSFNNLEGELPKFVYTDNYSFINLSGNKFHGDLSKLSEGSPICTRDLLESLLLASNNFTGLLPKDFFECLKNVTAVALENNKLFGKIPSDFPAKKRIRNCYKDVNNQCVRSNLQYLYLGKNHFSGEFPLASFRKYDGWEYKTLINVRENLLLGELNIDGTIGYGGLLDFSNTFISADKETMSMLVSEYEFNGESFGSVNLNELNLKASSEWWDIDNEKNTFTIEALTPPKPHPNISAITINQTLGELSDFKIHVAISDENEQFQECSSENNKCLTKKFYKGDVGTVLAYIYTPDQLIGIGADIFVVIQDSTGLKMETKSGWKKWNGSLKSLEKSYSISKLQTEFYHIVSTGKFNSKGLQKIFIGIMEKQDDTFHYNRYAGKLEVL